MRAAIAVSKGFRGGPASFAQVDEPVDDANQHAADHVADSHPQQVRQACQQPQVRERRWRVLDLLPKHGGNALDVPAKRRQWLCLTAWLEQCEPKARRARVENEVWLRHDGFQDSDAASSLTALARMLAVSRALLRCGTLLE